MANSLQEYLYNLATDKEKGILADLFKPILLILSFIYGLAVRCLVFLNRLFAVRLGCKVISVGNITLGGTGKTPLVEYIARYLKAQGHKVVILTRGYRRTVQSPQSTVHSATIDCKTMGDEPYMLFKRLTDIPMVIDRDRIRGARKAIKDYPADTVLLDDGFQQWRIKKDLEIVTLDAANPFGNRCLLPRGILREPLSALGRPDIIVLTKTNLAQALKPLKEYLTRINAGALLIESKHSPCGFYNIADPRESFPNESFRGKNAVLFCGIADPDSFEKITRGLGINSASFFKFEDHHCYTDKDLEKITHASKASNTQIIITTEKDAARLCGRDLSRLGRILALRIELTVRENEQGLHNRLLNLYSL